VYDRTVCPKLFVEYLFAQLISRLNQVYKKNTWLIQTEYDTISGETVVEMGDNGVHMFACPMVSKLARYTTLGLKVLPHYLPPTTKLLSCLISPHFHKTVTFHSVYNVQHFHFRANEM